VKRCDFAATWCLHLRGYGSSRLPRNVVQYLPDYMVSHPVNSSLHTHAVRSSNLIPILCSVPLHPLPQAHMFFLPTGSQVPSISVRFEVLKLVTMTWCWVVWWRVKKFRRKLLPSSSILKKESKGSFENVITLYRNTRCHISEDRSSWLRHYATSWKVAGSSPGIGGFFSIYLIFPAHYGPGFDSAYNRNEHQEFYWG
jgi:hypothetical protein